MFLNHFFSIKKKYLFLHRNNMYHKITKKPLPISLQLAIASELHYLTLYNPYAYNLVFVV